LGNTNSVIEETIIEERPKKFKKNFWFK
jgi:hypothetical protein